MNKHCAYCKNIPYIKILTTGLILQKNIFLCEDTNEFIKNKYLCKSCYLQEKYFITKNNIKYELYQGEPNE